MVNKAPCTPTILSPLEPSKRVSCVLTFATLVRGEHLSPGHAVTPNPIDFVLTKNQNSAPSGVNFYES